MMLEKPKIQFLEEQDWENWRKVFLELGFCEGSVEGRGDVLVAVPGHKFAPEMAGDLVSQGISIVFLDPGNAPNASDAGGVFLLATTYGVCPQLSQQIVRVWEEQWAQAAPEFLDLYRQLREHLLDGLPAEYRERLTGELLESDTLDLLAKGRLEEARKLAFRVVGTTTRKLD